MKITRERLLFLSIFDGTIESNGDDEIIIRIKNQSDHGARATMDPLKSMGSRHE